MKEKVFKDLPINEEQGLDEEIVYICEKCKADAENDEQVIFEFAESDLDDPNHPLCPNCGGELIEKEGAVDDAWDDLGKSEDDDDVSTEIELESEEEE